MEDTAQQPIEPQQATPPPMPQPSQQIAPLPAPSAGPSKTFLFALVFVLLAGSSAGAYFLGIKNAQPTTQSVTTAPIVIKPTPTPDPAANWRVYTSPDNMYRFKYPNNNSWKASAVTILKNTSVDIQCSHTTCPSPYNVYDFGGGISNVKSIDQYINKFNTTNSANSNHANPYIQDYKQLQFKGLDAVVSLTPAGKLAGSGPIVTYLIINNGQAYSFSYTYLDTSLNTITKLDQLPKPNPDFISTLIFSPATSPTGGTNQTQTIDTSTWKTYTNTQYHYTIQYPATYIPSGLDLQKGPVSSINAYDVLFTNTPLPNKWNDPIPSALTIYIMTTTQYTAEMKNINVPGATTHPTHTTSTLNRQAVDIYDGYGGYFVNKSYILQHDGYYYELTFDKSEDPSVATYPSTTSEKMITTFKFTD